MPTWWSHVILLTCCCLFQQLRCPRDGPRRSLPARPSSSFPPFASSSLWWSAADCCSLVWWQLVGLACVAGTPRGRCPAECRSRCGHLRRPSRCCGSGWISESSWWRIASWCGRKLKFSSMAAMFAFWWRSSLAPTAPALWSFAFHPRRSWWSARSTDRSMCMWECSARRVWTRARTESPPWSRRTFRWASESSRSCGWVEARRTRRPRTSAAGRSISHRCRTATSRVPTFRSRRCTCTRPDSSIQPRRSPSRKFREESTLAGRTRCTCRRAGTHCRTRSRGRFVVPAPPAGDLRRRCSRPSRRRRILSSWPSSSSVAVPVDRRPSADAGRWSSAECCSSCRSTAIPSIRRSGRSLHRRREGSRMKPKRHRRRSTSTCCVPCCPWPRPSNIAMKHRCDDAATTPSWWNLAGLDLTRWSRSRRAIGRTIRHREGSSAGGCRRCNTFRCRKPRRPAADLWTLDNALWAALDLCRRRLRRSTAPTADWLPDVRIRMRRAWADCTAGTAVGLPPERRWSDCRSGWFPGRAGCCRRGRLSWPVYCFLWKVFSDTLANIGEVKPTI